MTTKMNCDNPGCSYTADWECRTSDGKVKNLCQKCYLNEGYNKFPARGDAVRIGGDQTVDMSAIRFKVGNKWQWQYTGEAAEELSELKLRHGKWKAVAALLGVTEGSLSVYASQLRKKGYTVGAERSTEAEPVRNREVGAEESPLVELELVKLQRQRIAALEEALWQVEATIAKVIAS